MARRYSIDGQDTCTASTSILGLTSAATIRPHIYHMVVGSDSAAADNAAEFNLQRYTAAGTATGVTPQALDPSDPSALASSGEAHTVEPTYTSGAVMLNWAQNQRATFQWIATPGGEIILPATAANGAGVQSITVPSSTFNTVITIHYEE